MRFRILTTFITAMLLFSACGGGEDAGDDAPATTAAADSPATTAADTTIAPAGDAEDATTTTADTAATTTTSAATTTTGAMAAPGETLGAALFQGSASEITSGRFDAVITIVPSPDSGAQVEEVSMLMEGEFDTATRASRVSLDFGALMAAAPPAELAQIPPEMLALFEEPLELISLGDTAWMKWGLFNMLLGAEGWIEMPADETGNVTSDFGFNADTGSPAEMLQRLEEANAHIEELGREAVRGVDTNHYRAVLNLNELAQTLPADERAALEADFGQGIEELPIEMWIDDDGLLHRYRIELDAEDIDVDEGFESMTMTFEMYDHGESIEVVPPPEEDVTSIDELGGFFGIGG